ncbi:MAG: hypothetical protein GY719_19645 [bacterium]|nr:hypothetical protein [bacterium]
MKKLFLAACSALLLVGLPAALAQAPPAAGYEQLINSYTTGDQQDATVAVASDGDFMVVWRSDTAPDAEVGSILAQRFDAVGVPRGDEFRVSISTTRDNYTPDIAWQPGGDFVVVWAGPGYIPGSTLPAGRRYDSEGALVSNLQISVSSIDYAHTPSVAAAGDGSFVVVWDDDDNSPGPPDPDGRGILARRFDADGNGLENPFLVNTYTTDDQENADVAADGAGNFVVVWESVGSADSSNRGIQAQRFDSSGAKLGEEFRVSFNLMEDNLDPGVVMDEDGDFTVVWAGPGFLPGSKNLVGSRYASDGSFVDSFQASFSTIGSVAAPAIAIDDDGSFIVAWDSGYSTDTDFDGRSTHARFYDAGGDALGSDFQVNSWTTGDQRRPAVARNDGYIVVAWDSAGSDGDGLGIRAQRFEGFLFQDGFESGDTSAW